MSDFKIGDTVKIIKKAGAGGKQNRYYGMSGIVTSIDLSTAFGAGIHGTISVRIPGLHITRWFPTSLTLMNAVYKNESTNVATSSGANCSKCGEFNEYQSSPYTCYGCKIEM